ncbi:MAG: response regulator [Treponema sp.]|nr:response regulator [Treponema sp.]
MGEKKTILAIDDDPMDLKVLISMLTPVYNIRISKSVADAMNVMGQITPDLILLDIEMPDISGFEFLRTIRKNPKLMRTPVVIVSSHSGAEYVSHAERDGASCIVAKPVDRDNLLEKIKFAFENPVKNILEL